MICGVYIYMMFDRLAISFLCLTFLTAASGCRSHPQVQVAIKDGSTLCSKGTDYFPPVSNTETGNLHFGLDQAEWESNILRHMGEPSLYALGPSNAEPEYRFLWDRSLSEPIAVRLMVHGDGSGTLFVRMLSHCCMPPPPPPGKKKSVTWAEWLKIKLDRRVDLTPAQVQQVLSLFSRIEFRAGTVKTPGETTDGSDWIFESRVGGRY